MDTRRVGDVIEALNGYKVLDFLTALLEKRQFQDSPVRRQFLDDLPTLLGTLISHPDTMKCTRDTTFHQFTAILKTEVATMALKSSGWHFSAKNASSEQIDAFSIEGMAKTLTKQTPFLWAMLDTLLASDTAIEQRRAQHVVGTSKIDPSDPSAMCVDTANASDWSDEDEYWAQEAEGDWEEEFVEAQIDKSLPEDESDQARRTKRLRRACDRTQALLQIVRSIVYHASSFN